MSYMSHHVKHLSCVFQLLSNFYLPQLSKRIPSSSSLLLQLHRLNIIYMTFPGFYFMRIVFFRVSIKQIPPFEYFTYSNKPANDFLHLTLPLIESTMPHLNLSTVHHLVRQRCNRLPSLLIPSVLYIMSREDFDTLSDNFGNHLLSPINDASQIPD